MALLQVAGPKKLHAMRLPCKPNAPPYIDNFTIGMIGSICVDDGIVRNKKRAVFIVEQEAAFSTRPPKLLNQLRDA